MSSASHCQVTIARQRSDFASGTSKIRCLTSPNHENRHFSSRPKIYSAVDLRIRDVDCPEALGKVSLISKVCSLSAPRRSDEWIWSTRALTTPVAINMFAFNGPAFFLVALLLYERTLCRCEDLFRHRPFIFPPTHYRLDRNYQKVQGASPSHVCVLCSFDFHIFWPRHVSVRRNVT